MKKVKNPWREIAEELIPELDAYLQKCLRTKEKNEGEKKK